MTGEFKYYAFISYNKADEKWGKRLQKKLEGYRMPATLCSKHGWDRKPIRPVFFAPSDIQPGGLSKELQERLKASKNLIVICSPSSAKSEWVGKEIAFFHSLGRTDNIHFFIVDGIPNSNDPKTDCFNPVIKQLGIPEILGANINEKVSLWPWINRERAYVQIITKLLNVEFDSLWQRHKRRKLRNIFFSISAFLATLMVIFATWQNSQPTDVSVLLTEKSIHNDNLPPLKDAVVTLYLENEVKADTVRALTTGALFSNIPHEALGKEARITVLCSNWMPVDTVIVLKKLITMNMYRDPVPFGNISIGIWDAASSRYIPNLPLSINLIETTTDENGRVHLLIPLQQQSTQYTVNCAFPLETNIITMPVTESSVLLTK